MRKLRGSISGRERSSCAACDGDFILLLASSVPRHPWKSYARIWFIFPARNRACGSSSRVYFETFFSFPSGLRGKRRLARIFWGSGGDRHLAPDFPHDHIRQTLACLRAFDHFDRRGNRRAFHHPPPDANGQDGHALSGIRRPECRGGCGGKKRGNFDGRAAQPPVAALERDAALAKLRARVPGFEVQFDPLTGSANHVMATGRFLTGAAAVANPVNGYFYEPVRRFMAENAVLFGHGAEALDGTRITRNDVTRRRLIAMATSMRRSCCTNTRTG